MSSSIRQLTVYADVRAAPVLELIRKFAKEVCADYTVFPPAATTVSTAAALPKLSFMKQWEEEKKDIVGLIKEETTFMHQFDCFITEQQTARSGEVAYALYRRQMPVLALNCSGGSDGGSSGGSSGNREEASPRASDAPVTGVQRYLYHTRPAGTSVEDALRSFFTFPAQPGALRSLESDEPASAAFQEVCEGVRQQLETANSKVLFLRKDGYPLHDQHAAMLPAPAPMYDYLLKSLAADDSAAAPATLKRSRAAEASSAADIQPVAPEQSFLDLLRHNPQLYGALSAFNRCENRSLMRFLLLRGYNLVVLDFFSSTTRALASVLGASVASLPASPTSPARAQPVNDGHEVRKDAQTVAAELRHHSAALRSFEGHWLEMALPTRSVCFSFDGADAKGGNANWLQLMQTPTPSAAAPPSQAQGGEEPEWRVISAFERADDVNALVREACTALTA